MTRAIKTQKCRLCSGDLLGPALSLGEQPISNRLPPAGEKKKDASLFPLDIVICADCNLPQLAHDLEASEHFHDDYAYLSGASSTWVDHCNRYAHELMEFHGVAADDFVVEVGSNDGTLLKAIKAKGMRILGVEPSGNIAEIALKAGIETMNAFFNEQTAKKIKSKYGAPKCLIGNNVLAHVPDTDSFLRAARDLIAPDGFLCFEFPTYTNILKHNFFDTIYHEHYVYLGAGPLVFWAQRNAMTISAIERQDTHGGSLRVFLKRSDERSTHLPAKTQEIINEEKSFGGLKPWRELQNRLDVWRGDFEKLMSERRAAGDIVVGYGAASKASVITNFLRLTSADIAYCCDASPIKQGRMIPGANIPIVAPRELKIRPPDMIIVFPWNIFGEIRNIVAELITKPTKIVRPLPNIETFKQAPRVKL